VEKARSSREASDEAEKVIKERELQAKKDKEERERKDGVARENAESSRAQEDAQAQNEADESSIREEKKRESGDKFEKAIRDREAHVKHEEEATKLKKEVSNVPAEEQAKEQTESVTRAQVVPDMTRKELQAWAKKHKAAGVNGNSSSDTIREAMQHFEAAAETVAELPDVPLLAAAPDSFEPYLFEPVEGPHPSERSLSAQDGTFAAMLGPQGSPFKGKTAKSSRVPPFEVTIRGGDIDRIFDAFESVSSSDGSTHSTLNW
jgi:hypothetical protein